MPSALDPPDLQRRGSSPAARELDDALTAAEVAIYLSTAGMPERAAELEARARAGRLTSRVRRAQLLSSDVLSRRGELEPALHLQLSVLAEAERDGDRQMCARAHCQLASTYDRLADVPKSQAAAAAGVHLLEPSDPLTWQAEHTMVLALFTSYRRHGTIDYTTFDEAVRLAREAGDPVLLLSVLNNYVFVLLEAKDPRGIALSAQMEEVIEDRLGGAAPSAALDTIAVARLAAGDLDGAARLSQAAIAKAPHELLEPHALPAMVLTAAAVERARGDAAAAAERLREARRLAERDRAPEPGAQALKELSELAAEGGDFETAYRLLQQYLEEWARFQTERSERHAATLQAIYGADVERKRRLALEQLADTDPLTGLWNRRYLDRHLATLAGAPIALALLDLDHFKQVNDRFSHDMGDAVLRRVADLLRLEAGTDAGGSSFPVRLGGEEFVLVMPGVPGETARRHCERVRAQVQATEWGRLAPGLGVTVSIGIAVDARGMASGSELLSRADAALYEAKRQGRNRVVADRADF